MVRAQCFKIFVYFCYNQTIADLIENTFQHYVIIDNFITTFALEFEYLYLFILYFAAENEWTKKCVCVCVGGYKF